MVLNDAQVAEIKLLRSLCDRRNAAMVLIGAHAFLVHFPCRHRFTADIDLVIDLNEEEFSLLSAELARDGWEQLHNQEHRWLTPGRNLFDLLPAGPMLRAAGRIVWPRSGFEMGLAGFDHVFVHARETGITPDLRLNVISPDVLALLKMIAFVDDPWRRRKDLLDLREILTRYEAASDRMFSDEVFDAGLADFGLGCAFLLGRDLGALCSAQEIGIVRQFIAMIEAPGMHRFTFASGSGLVGETIEDDTEQIVDALVKGLGDAHPRRRQ